MSQHRRRDGRCGRRNRSARQITYFSFVLVFIYGGSSVGKIPVKGVACCGKRNLSTTLYMRKRVRFKNSSPCCLLVVKLLIFHCHCAAWHTIEPTFPKGTRIYIVI